MSLAGRKAVVLVDQMYQELEVWYPLYRLREAGVEAVLCGPQQGQTYPAKLGYPAVSDVAAADVNAADIDCLIIPGGYAPDHLRRHAAVNKLVKEAMRLNKVVASICHGGWMLVEADALRGRKVTSFFAIRAEMVHAGAEWIDAEVVVDKNLVTSRKPDDLPAFMRETLRALDALK